MSLYIYAQDGMALSAATAKSVIELKSSSSERVKIKEWWVDFDGVTSSAVPVKVEVGRFSAAVTTMGTAGTAGKFDGGDGTAGTTVGGNGSTEGAGTIDAGAWIKRISPTSGFHYIAPLGQELILPVSGFWRIRCTAAATVNVTAGVVWEE